MSLLVTGLLIQAVTGILGARGRADQGKRAYGVLWTKCPE
jgi:hypothetical protein